MRLGETRSRCGQFKEKKVLFTLPEMETRFLVSQPLASRYTDHGNQAPHKVSEKHENELQIYNIKKSSLPFARLYVKISTPIFRLNLN
jgi:hypothetical protein